VKLLSFITNGQLTYGAIKDNRVHDLSTQDAPDLKTCLAKGLDKAGAALEKAGEGQALDAIEYAPVIPNPDRILCVGLNYESHRVETGRSKAEFPTIFTRFASSQVGHQQPIVLPKVSTNLDYEGELAVIIGRPGRYIPAYKALEYVAGYACYNDASIRDWQRHSHQFTPGKNFPATGAFGPWMVTADEMGKLDGKTIETRLNGEVMQHATLSQMIFSVPEIIAYISGFTPLVPGDAIVTGTPGGVGFKRQPPVWMRKGDVVEVEIEGVGLLENTIAREWEAKT
jgi:2-keto-4-pentenoate hydratase/2-oxohepta-3-ene-1,7-dioic acid hydratase in catechol pathway